MRVLTRAWRTMHAPAALPRDIAEGSVGAGTGCTVGKAAGRAHAMKGGFGCSLEEHGDVLVAALAVVNAFGDVRDSNGRIMAGARNPQGGWSDSAALVAQYSLGSALPLADSHQTTLCAIVTNAALSRRRAARARPCERRGALPTYYPGRHCCRRRHRLCHGAADRVCCAAQPGPYRGARRARPGISHRARRAPGQGARRDSGAGGRLTDHPARGRNRSRGTNLQPQSAFG